MSNAVTNRCRYAVLPPPAKSVLMCLADRANDLGECWPAQSYICKWTCYGRTAVINAVRYLEEKGLITVSRENGQRNRTTINLAAVDAFVLQQSTSTTYTAPVRRTDSDVSTSQTAPVRVANQTSPAGAHKTSGPPYTKGDKRQLSPQWSLSQELRTWAVSERPDLELGLLEQKFKNHYVATGDAKADWEACFRTWVLKERKAASNSSPPVATPPAVGRDPALLKIEADLRLAAPMTPSTRENLVQLRNLFAASSRGGQS